MSALSLRQLQDERRGGSGCPKCGCLMASVDENGARVCRHCGHRLNAAVPPAMAFKTAMRCPKCDSLGHVTSTRAAEGYRWWKCPKCGQTWKEAGKTI